MVGGGRLTASRVLSMLRKLETDSRGRNVGCFLKNGNFNTQALLKNVLNTELQSKFSTFPSVWGCAVSCKGMFLILPLYEHELIQIIKTVYENLSLADGFLL